MTLLTSSPQNTVSTVIEQRMTNYLTACSIPQSEHAKLMSHALNMLVRPLNSKPRISLELALQKLRASIKSQSTAPTKDESIHRLAFYLAQAPAKVPEHRGWSMPLVYRSSMTPENHTPKIIKALRCLTKPKSHPSCQGT